MNKGVVGAKKYCSDPKRKVQYPASDNFVPKRLALSIDPPMISICPFNQVLEYLVPDTGRLYHHKIRLQDRMEHTLKTEELLAFIKDNHRPYFKNGKISDQQLAKMIQKIVENYEFDQEDSKRSPVEKLDSQEDPNWDFDVEDNTGFDFV